MTIVFNFDDANENPTDDDNDDDDDGAPVLGMR